MSIEFFITSLIVVLAPGTGVIYTVATGLARGGLVSIAAAFGCTLGILPHIAAAVFGLAALLHASALAFQVVKIAGVLYLLFMAWSILRDKGTLSVNERIDARSFGKVIVRGFLINILNPKLSIFFLAFLPQFIPADTSTVTGSMITLGGIFMLMTFMVFIGYGIFAAAVRRHIIDKPKVMAWSRRIFAGTFVALGAKLAFAER